MTMKKTVSIFLSIVLLFSLCVPAFAAVPHYDNFLVIGDSIPAGYGLAEYDAERFDFVKGSYPYIVKKAIGAGEESFNASHLGMRVREALCMLNGDLSYADDFTLEFFNTVNYGGDHVLENKLLREAGYYDEKIANADLIAVNLGNNDIMGSLFYIILKLIRSLAETDAAYTAMYEGVMDIFRTLGFQEKTIDFLLIFVQESLQSEEKYNSFLDALSMVIEQNGISEFIDCWDILMGRIFALKKPEAKVVVMNVYNPGFAICGGDETQAREQPAAIIVNQLFQVLIDAVNYEIEYGSAYRDGYAVVDTSSVTALLEAGSTPENLHPGTEAHEHLAQLFLAALDRFCTHENTLTLFQKNASVFHNGYSGDIFCADCGVLLEQGKVVTPLGNEIQLPKGMGYALLTALVRTSIDAATRIFSSLFSVIK